MEGRLIEQLQPSANSRTHVLVLLFPEAALGGAHGALEMHLLPMLALPSQDTDPELDLFCEVKAVLSLMIKAIWDTSKIPLNILHQSLEHMTARGAALNYFDGYLLFRYF